MNYGPVTDPKCDPTWEEIAPYEYNEWVRILTARRCAEILADASLLEDVKINAMTRCRANEDRMNALDDCLRVARPWDARDAGEIFVAMIHAQLNEAAESYAVDRANEPGAAAEYRAWVNR